MRSGDGLVECALVRSNCCVRLMAEKSMFYSIIFSYLPMKCKFRSVVKIRFRHKLTQRYQTLNRSVLYATVSRSSILFQCRYYCLMPLEQSQNNVRRNLDIRFNYKKILTCNSSKKLSRVDTRHV